MRQKSLSDFPVPASLIKKYAREFWQKHMELTTERLEFAENFWWSPACEAFRIPYLSYSEDPESGESEIPDTIRQAINGKRLIFPVLLDLPHHNVHVTYILVDIDKAGSGNFRTGEVVDHRSLSDISIAKLSYFDLRKLVVM